MSARRFTPSLHPRDHRGRFTKRGGASKSAGHRGISFETKRHTYPLTVKTNEKGNVTIRPYPMRTIETNAHVRGKLIGQTNTRITRKGAVVEQVHVTKRHQGKGIAKAMLADQQKHLGRIPMTVSSYRSDEGERLAKSLQGNARTKRVVNANTPNISRNITEGFASEQAYFAQKYKQQKASAQRRAALTRARKKK